MKPKQIIKLILAIIGLIAFFLPWINTGLIGQFSGYSLFEIGVEKKFEEILWLLLLPFLFILVIIFQLFSVKGNGSYFTKIIEFIPFVIIVFAIAKGIQLLGIKNVNKVNEKDIELILNTVKSGVYLNIITAFLLVFFPRNKFIKIEE